MKLKYIFALCFLAGVTAYGQVKTNQKITEEARSNAFLDASENTDGQATSVGKGLLFPQTDLSTFKLDINAADGVNYPTYFDGMIVYNTKEGGSTTDTNIQTTNNLQKGFYYFSNPTGKTNGNITNGKWVRLNDGISQEGQEWVYNEQLNGILAKRAKTPVFINNNGKVGINTHETVGRLNIGDSLGLSYFKNYIPTGVNIAVSSETLNERNSPSFAAGFGVRVIADDKLTALDSVAINGSYLITEIPANRTISSSGGWITGAYIAAANRSQFADSIAHIFGARVDAFNLSPSKVKSLAGIIIRTASAEGEEQPGSVKNKYGVLIGDVRDGVDNNYALYTNKGTVRFGDKLGVGVNNPTEMVEVAGKVKAAAFMGTNGATLFPDYVFQKYYTGTSSLKADYNFKTLSQVEDFVKTNGHLPGYQSAEAIKKQGYIDLMETQLTNVEKIEELYLHSIEQDKALKAKDAKIAELENELKSQKENFETRLQKLETLLVK
ncbi:hypothetical protein [Riemerella anatipestifer]|uniref:hypothetical protein n=1 Tax=Riemerella anatipestifer TaxID=34085 RepID=UPI00137534CC|nr:hypothetical protein [Riemerella anatipestifer]